MITGQGRSRSCLSIEVVGLMSSERMSPAMGCREAFICSVAAFKMSSRSAGTIMTTLGFKSVFARSAPMAPMTT